MKKSIAILSILGLLSCNSDDNNKECKCTLSYYIGDSTEIHYLPDVIMDCNTKVPITNLDEKLPKNYRIRGYADCNFDK